MRNLSFFPIVLLFFLLLMGAFATGPGPAWAHRVTVFAWVDGDMVFCESSFAGGRPVKNGEILVEDQKGSLLLSGRTDDRGEFSFTAPQKSEMTIVVNAGEGHRGEWKVRAEEFGMEPESPDEDAGPEAGETKQKPMQVPENADLEALVQKAVEQALDKKLAPLKRQLALAGREKTGLAGILGGIGYILGLVGLAAYMDFRKKKKALEDK